MIRVTAWPTVEWLHKRRADRKPVVTGHRFRTCHPSTGMVRILNRYAAEGTRAKAVEWVSTPDGELSVDVILERGERRVAINFSANYESSGPSQDALVLVFGGFDALYRVRRAQSATQIQDVVYALVCDLPGWFTLQGRLTAGRKASTLAVVAAQSGSARQRQFEDGTTLERIRLCVASDWVHQFENALRH